MFLHKPISVLSILTVIFVLLLCSPWAAIAQTGEQRLIPLTVELVNGTPTVMPDTIPLGIQEKTAFVVYGRAPEPAEVGIFDPDSDFYRHILSSAELDRARMPDLDTFFGFGGTLELLTRDLTSPEIPVDDAVSTLNKHDLVISEIMWAIDEGITNTNEEQEKNQEIQWIELYNTTGKPIENVVLYFLFTPFKSHPLRETVELEVDDSENLPGTTKTTYKVLDSVDTLFTGLWKLPGKRGDRPNTAFVSGYRDIDYDTVEDGTLERAAQLAGIPFGANPNSWKATPTNGRRNTVRIEDGTAVIELISISTPGAKHVKGIHVGRLTQSSVSSNLIVINEVRNDTSKDNVDWVELKNIGSGIQQIKDWELSIVTEEVTDAGLVVLKDTDLVDLPEYELASGEILLLLNADPWGTPIAAGMNAAGADHPRDGIPAYVVGTSLDLPNTGKFMLLIRSKSDQNGKDKDIQDYAGNGFFENFSDNISTEFWPRLGQYRPSASSIANFGDNTFGSPNQAWKRKRYQANDGHHIDAWEAVGTQGGLGYDPGAELSTSPGTPGYENDALKAGINRLLDGAVSISEIMYDPGPNGNIAQWIELYNSSLTEAVSLNGWSLRIRNLHDGEGRYLGGTIAFKDVAISPNQTLLIVYKVAATNLPDGRVYNIYVQHRRDLNVSRTDLLLNPRGFYVSLTNRVDPDLLSDDEVVDEVGNLTAQGTRAPVWVLPQTNSERRQSIVRLYGIPFTPVQDVLGGGGPEAPEDGLAAVGWRLFPENGANVNFYGVHDDLANPGYRRGGPLPVTLAGFRPVRTQSGEVLINWRTESELNNAGFNILRSESESRAGDFRVINVKGIIPGHGTSSEQHLYSYTDTTAKPNVIYYYRIEDVSFDGTRQTLATVRLKGDVSPAGKLTTTWSSLKARD